MLSTGKEIIPIEVKFQSIKSKKLPVSLKNFIKMYAPKKAYIVNIDYEESTKFNGSEIKFIPFHMFPFEEFL